MGERSEVKRNSEEENRSEDLFHRHLTSISKQSSLFFVGSMFTFIVQYIFKIYTSRKLGTEGVGIIAVGMSFISFFAVFVNLGLNHGVVKYVPVFFVRNQKAKILSLARLGVCSTVIVGLICGSAIYAFSERISIKLFSSAGQADLILFFAVLFALGGVDTILTNLLTGFKQSSIPKLFHSFIGLPLLILFVVIFFQYAPGVRSFLFASIFSTLIVIALMGYYSYRILGSCRKEGHGARKLPLEVYAFGAQMIFMGFIDFFGGHFETLIMSMYVPIEKIGIYSVASALSVNMGFFLYSINSIFSPTIAELYQKGEMKLLGKLYKTINKWAIVFTMPLYLFFVFFSTPFMGVFGGGFASGGLILIMISTAVMISVGTGSNQNMLAMSGNQGITIRYMIVVVILCVLFNFLLIPRLGIYGTACVRLFYVIAINFCGGFFVYKRLKALPYDLGFLKLLPPVAATGLVLWISRNFLTGKVPALGLLMAGLIISHVFFLAFWFSYGPSMEDKRFLKSLWMKFRRKGGANVSLF